MGLNSVFEAKFFNQPQSDIIKISKERYCQWQRQYLFDALKNIGYGKSFCKHFGITDYILEFSKKEQECHSYILKTYVQLTA